MKKTIVIIFSVILVLQLIPYTEHTINKKRGIVKVHSEAELAKIYYQNWKVEKQKEWLGDRTYVSWFGGMMHNMSRGIGGGTSLSSKSGGHGMIINQESVPESATQTNKARNYSETNAQVIGVQEGDYLKTDGDYIYHLTNKDDKNSNNKLIISKAILKQGDPSDVIFEKDFSSELTAKEMYINKDKLVLVFNNEIKNGLEIMIYDIKNKTKPTLENNLFMIGASLQTRITDDHLYLLKQQYLSFDGFNPFKWGVKEIIPSFVDYTTNEKYKSKLNEVYYHAHERPDTMLSFYKIPLEDHSLLGSRFRFSEITELSLDRI